MPWRRPLATHDPGKILYIITPDKVIECTGRRRLAGLVWDDLTAEKIEEVPVLNARLA